MTYRKYHTPEQALQKLRHYCAYQERSHYEVREKLYSLGIHRNEVERLIAQLIEENYLNEERFACQYAGGHFRLKQWGRNRIRQGLQQKKVSEYNIRIALREIEEEEYLATLRKLAEKKWNSISGAGVNRFSKLARTSSFLIGRGFEPDLVRRILQDMAVD